jgi:hypothetical protein
LWMLEEGCYHPRVRWVFGLLLVALGCDSFAGAAPRDVRSSQPGVGGTKQGSMNAGGMTSGAPPTLFVDAPAVEPEFDPDWCTVAEQRGATFCEVHENTVEHVLEYCEPAAVAPSAGGAGGTGGNAGADEGGAGAGGAPGAAGQPAECRDYDRPPDWVYDLLIQCAAHCGVGIRKSERQLEGSCCYLAWSEYYGR